MLLMSFSTHMFRFTLLQLNVESHQTRMQSAPSHFGIKPQQLPKEPNTKTKISGEIVWLLSIKVRSGDAFLAHVLLNPCIF